MKHYLLYGVLLLLGALMVEAETHADTFSESMYACQRKCEKEKTFKDPCCVKRCAYYACIDHHSTVTTRGGQAIVDPAARNAAVVPCFPHMEVLVSCVKEDIANKEKAKNSGLHKKQAKDSGEHKVFSNPMTGGKRLDWCYVWGSSCGERAATEFCRKKGFRKATSWSIARDIGLQSPTYVLGSGQTCDKSFCDGFSSVTCE